MLHPFAHRKARSPKNTTAPTFRYEMGVKSFNFTFHQQREVLHFLRYGQILNNDSLAGADARTLGRSLFSRVLLSGIAAQFRR
jgi:hypothetical protein